MKPAYRLLNDLELDHVSGGLMVDPPEGEPADSCEVYVPSYTLSAGLYLEDVYAVEFVLDDAHNVLSTYLLLDDGSSVATSGLNSVQDGAGLTPDGAVLGDGGVMDLATTTPVKPRTPTCTVTVGTSTQTVSGSGTISATIGVVGGSRSSGSTTTTYTTTITVQGTLINGRCVTPAGTFPITRR